MSLKYYKAYSPSRFDKPKNSYIDDMNAIHDLAFDNAPNVYYGDEPNGVLYEKEYGSNEFIPVPIIRVDEVVAYNTGLFSADDFKIFIFKNDFKDVHNFTYGSKFKWQNNTWLVISSTRYGGEVTHSVEVRRCNNVARYYDSWGNKIYEPCILDTVLRFTRNNTSNDIITSNGEQKMWIQRNERTNLIHSNQRFLFGPASNRIAYKVYASGAKNYLNTETFDDESMSLSEVYMQFDQIDFQRDDIKDGFADARVTFYTIEGNDISGEHKVGDIIPLEFSVYANDLVTDFNVLYSIDNLDVAHIENDSIHIVNNGTFTLTITMENNLNITKSYVILVVAKPVVEYKIMLTPDRDYILQDDVQVFECQLYKNGALDDTMVEFEFKDNSIGVPYDNYEIKIIDANHFAIYNHGMFMSKPVKVLCTTGEYSQEFDFKLKGVY